MAYLRFADSNSLIPCAVSPSGHVVTLKFEKNVVVDTSGFHLFLDKEGEVDIGGKSYLNFKTIYRNDEETEKYNGYQLSDDGSIYVPPKPPEPPVPPVPPEPTLEELQEEKVIEMNNMQQSVIQAGVDVTLSDESVEHFTLTDHDQTSLMGLQSQVAAGVDKIPWHPSDETLPCKFYSSADMALITTAAMAYVTWHVTYFRDLRIYIRSLQDKEAVKAITYGVDIPEEYQSDVLKELIAARAKEM